MKATLATAIISAAVSAVKIPSNVDFNVLTLAQQDFDPEDPVVTALDALSDHYENLPYVQEGLDKVDDLREAYKVNYDKYTSLQSDYERV